MRAVLLFLCASLSVGCAHTVRIESDPPGALVLFDGKEQGTTPLEVSEGLLGNNPHAAIEVVRGADRVKIGIKREYRIGLKEALASGGLLALDLALIALPFIILSNPDVANDPAYFGFIVLAPLTVPYLIYALPLTLAPFFIGQPHAPDVVKIDMVGHQVTTTPPAEVMVHTATEPPGMLE